MSNRIPHKPWITSAILTSIRHKNKLYLKFKSNPTDSNKSPLANYRNKSTNLIRVFKKIYYCNLLDKQTWKVVNGFLGRDGKKSFRGCFNINGTVTADFNLLLMVLMIFLKINIAPRLSNGIPDINVSPNHFLNNIPSPKKSLFFNPTDHDEVIKICASLKACASPGYDDIKPDVVKSVSHLLAYPLVHIFNLSMSTGFVSDQFKLDKVVAI